MHAFFIVVNLPGLHAVIDKMYISDEIYMNHSQTIDCFSFQHRQPCTKGPVLKVLTSKIAAGKFAFFCWIDKIVLWIFPLKCTNDAMIYHIYFQGWSHLLSDILWDSFDPFLNSNMTNNLSHLHFTCSYSNMGGFPSSK